MQVDPLRKDGQPQRNHQRNPSPSPGPEDSCLSGPQDQVTPGNGEHDQNKCMEINIIFISACHICRCLQHCQIRREKGLTAQRIDKVAYDSEYTHGSCCQARSHLPAVRQQRKPQRKQEYDNPRQEQLFPADRTNHPPGGAMCPDIRIFQHKYDDDARRKEADNADRLFPFFRQRKRSPKCAEPQNGQNGHDCDPFDRKRNHLCTVRSHICHMEKIRMCKKPHQRYNKKHRTNNGANSDSPLLIHFPHAVFILPFRLSSPACSRSICI